MGEARCGDLLFCHDPSLLWTGYDLTPDLTSESIFKMLNEGLGPGVNRGRTQVPGSTAALGMVLPSLLEKLGDLRANSCGRQ